MLYGHTLIDVVSSAETEKLREAVQKRNWRKELGVKREQNWADGKGAQIAENYMADCDCINGIK